MRDRYEEDYEAPYSPSARHYANLSDQEMDKLFYLNSIRSKLFEIMKQVYSSTWQANESTLLYADGNQRAKWMFASKMLSVYGQSIPQVKHLLNSVRPEMQEDELRDKRVELIMKLVRTKIGQHWMNTFDQDDGWEYVAQNLYGEANQLRSEEVDSFLLTIDQISIINDLLQGRGSKYRLGYNTNNAKSVEVIKHHCNKEYVDKAAKILVELHRYIDKARKAKAASMPIRVLLDLKILRERLPWSFIKQEFGSDNNSDSSYNDYTNVYSPDIHPYKGDKNYNLMMSDFEKDFK